jgi:hypothetical protein
MSSAASRIVLLALVGAAAATLRGASPQLKFGLESCDNAGLAPCGAAFEVCAARSQAA